MFLIARVINQLVNCIVEQLVMVDVDFSTLALLKNLWQLCPDQNPSCMVLGPGPKEIRLCKHRSVSHSPVTLPLACPQPLPPLGLRLAPGSETVSRFPAHLVDVSGSPLVSLILERLVCTGSIGFLALNLLPVLVSKRDVLQERVMLLHNFI